MSNQLITRGPKYPIIFGPIKMIVKFLGNDADARSSGVHFINKFWRFKHKLAFKTPFFGILNAIYFGA